MTARVTVVYGRDADADLVARAARRALAGLGCLARISRTESGDLAVWIVERGNPIALGRWFAPGQQLVIESSGTWRIEDATPEPAKRTPDEWCAKYGIRILDHDGWRSENAPAWTEPLTLAEFYDRATQCTASADWTRIASDVKAAAA